MHEASILTSFFLIFTGAAVLATAALYTRQPLLVAYIAIGAVLGPYGSGLISDVRLIEGIAEIGIIFLLFLLGLDMQPKNLVQTLRETLLVGIASALLFGAMGLAVGMAFQFSAVESVMFGVAAMFSSTIIGIKLLPTTVLHHRRTGEVVVSLLLLQDLIAIAVLLVIGESARGGSADGGDSLAANLIQVFIALPALIGVAFAAVRFVLLPLIARFDAFHEYIFLLAIGWCLGLAELAEFAGLSKEIGAFIAGVTVAVSPISQYIAISLKPLRDFFLVLFFFSIGASFNLALLPEVLLPAVVLAALSLAAKPPIFRWLLRAHSETRSLAWEIGFRLGQLSEFSLLIAYVATASGLIGNIASHVIQAAVIIAFLVSSYLVVLRYPTPIAIDANLRRD